MSAGAHTVSQWRHPSGWRHVQRQMLTYRFLKTGRYLVLCMNRVTS